jgi:hypothetical protein
VPQLTLLTCHSSPDCQPFSRCPLRRCSRVRDRLSHHRKWCSLRIFRRQDRSLAVRQAHRRRRLVKGRRVVGPCKQADDTRCKLCLFPAPFACDDVLGEVQRHVMHGGGVAEDPRSVDGRPLHPRACPASRFMHDGWTPSPPLFLFSNSPRAMLCS